MLRLPIINLSRGGKCKSVIYCKVDRSVKSHICYFDHLLMWAFSQTECMRNFAVESKQKFAMKLVTTLAGKYCLC